MSDQMSKPTQRPLKSGKNKSSNAKFDLFVLVFVCLIPVVFYWYGDSRFHDKNGDSTILIYLLFMIFYEILFLSCFIVEFMKNSFSMRVIRYLIYSLLPIIYIAIGRDITLAKVEIEARVYARDSGQCRARSKNEKYFSVCYAYINTPEASMIVIDKYGSFSKNRNQWPADFLLHIKNDEDGYIKSTLESCGMIATNLFEDVFWLESNCS